MEWVKVEREREKERTRAREWGPRWPGQLTAGFSWGQRARISGGGSEAESKTTGRHTHTHTPCSHRWLVPSTCNRNGQGGKKSPHTQNYKTLLSQFKLLVSVQSKVVETTLCMGEIFGGKVITHSGKEIYIPCLKCLYFLYLMKKIRLKCVWIENEDILRPPQKVHSISLEVLWLPLESMSVKCKLRTKEDDTDSTL